MADQHSSNELAPSLQAVLSSLSVNLEEELNRYRRNRVLEAISAADNSSQDVFAAIEETDFDVDPIAAASPALALSPTPGTPPPLPPNKKLLEITGQAADADPAIAPASPYGSSTDTTPVSFNIKGSTPTSPHIDTTVSPLLSEPMPKATLNGEPAFANEFTRLNFANPSLAETDLPAPMPGIVGSGPDIELNATGASALSISTPIEATTPYGASSTSGSSYLASSEKLLESLNEGSATPEPVDTTFKPRRKQVSLLAGATLGFLGLVAGLGASYLMSNPIVAQRLASGFSGSESVATASNSQTFDPPGPDLSAQEFVDINIDNLSSLNMPQTGIDPLSAPAGPASPTALPPIANPSAVAQSAGNSLGNQPSAIPNTEMQAAVIPTGENFYVTVPFTNEQALSDVRQNVEEAFVRQFSDGNRVQLAVFDNAATAQQFIAELQEQGVSAQIYGPTTE